MRGGVGARGLNVTASLVKKGIAVLLCQRAGLPSQRRLQECNRGPHAVQQNLWPCAERSARAEGRRRAIPRRPLPCHVQRRLPRCFACEARRHRRRQDVRRDEDNAAARFVRSLIRHRDLRQHRVLRPQSVLRCRGRRRASCRDGAPCEAVQQSNGGGDRCAGNATSARRTASVSCSSRPSTTWRCPNRCWSWLSCR